jgi:undecaprenyl-diphosphatase
MPSAPDPRDIAPSVGGEESRAAGPRPSDPAAPPPNPPRRDETIGHRDLRVWRTVVGRQLVRAAAWLVGVVKRVWRHSSLQATVVLTFLVGGALATYAAEAATDVYEDVSHSDGIAGLDLPVLDWAVSTRTPTRDQWVTAWTDIGGPVWGTVLVGAIVVILTVVWRRWTPALILLPGLIGSLAITVIGKDLTGRGRPPFSLAVPPYEVSTSFPSGHTLNATVLAGLTAYLLLILTRRMWLGALGVLAAATYAITMGLSRVWLGHHWLTDVIAGWLLGVAWVIGVITVHRIVLTLRDRDPEPPRP